MLRALSDCIKEGMNLEDVKVILKGKKDILSMYPEYKKIPILKNYILLIKGEISYEKIHKLRNIFEDIIKTFQESSKKVKKLEILEKELETILRANEIFFSGEGSLDDFFLFLRNKKYVLIENNKVILNKGIDEFSVTTSLGKLKKVEEFSTSFGKGETYALKVGMYQIIVQSENKTLDPFLKKVLKSRLMWLNKIYYEKYQYSVDELTGLYTRKKFLNDLPMFKGKSCILINLKNFRFINEIYSPHIGDKVLHEFGHILKKNSKSENVYRIFGDKFAIVFNNDIQSINFYRNIVKYLQTGLKVFHEVLNEYVSVNIQTKYIIVRKIDSNFLERSMIAFKKTAYQDKDLIFYEDTIMPQIEKELSSLEIIQKAIETDKVVPAFQKIVNINDGSTYFEALMRIKSGRKVYLPGDFLTPAKETGLYPKLSNIIFDKVVEVIKNTGKRISINIELTDILRKNFIDYTIMKIKRSGISPDNVVFELTETEDMGQMIKYAQDVLFSLKKAGFWISIDDFGSGYSNFSYLTQLPIDIIKIDGSLIKNLEKNKKNLLIVKSIISMSKLLNIKTVAEFVHSKETYRIVEKLGVDYVQGYYIEKPKFKL
ncbi:bifunctional diguanylate cyclase/phosphodiesterase [Persephonella sp.]